MMKRILPESRCLILCSVASAGLVGACSAPPGQITSTDADCDDDDDCDRDEVCDDGSCVAVGNEGEGEEGEGEEGEGEEGEGEGAEGEGEGAECAALDDAVCLVDRLLCGAGTCVAPDAAICGLETVFLSPAGAILGPLDASPFSDLDAECPTAGDKAVFLFAEILEGVATSPAQSAAAGVGEVNQRGVVSATIDATSAAFVICFPPEFAVGDAVFLRFVDAAGDSTNATCGVLSAE